MSMVSESKPWCDITSAENALGIDSQPFTTASPFFQISLSLFARTGDSSRPARFPSQRHRGLYASGPSPLRDLPHHQMAPVAGVRAHLAGPAALVHRLGERLAQQHVGALELVQRVEARRALRVHRLALAADDHAERLDRPPRGRDHAGHLEDQRDVLGVVDLVEELLAVGRHVHGGGEEEAAGDRHRGILLEWGALPGERARSYANSRGLSPTLTPMRASLALAAVIVLAPLAAGTQPAAKVSRVGVLEIVEEAANAPNLEAFRQKLAAPGDV